MKLGPVLEAAGELQAFLQSRNARFCLIGGVAVQPLGGTAVYPRRRADNAQALEAPPRKTGSPDAASKAGQSKEVPGSASDCDPPVDHLPKAQDGAASAQFRSLQRLHALRGRFPMTPRQGCVMLIAHAYAKKKCVLSSSSGFGD